MHVNLWMVDFALMGSWCENDGEEKCAGAANCDSMTGLKSPSGMALDPSSGTLYVANTGNNSLCRVPASGGACSVANHRVFCCVCIHVYEYALKDNW